MKSKITLIQILFLLIFAGSVFFIVTYFRDKQKTVDEYHYLQSVVQQAREESKETKEEELPNATAEAKPEVDLYAREENGMLSAYYPLYQQNNDMVGWIKIKDTDIDYPVLYNAESNAYYLHRNFKKETSDAGIPFLDEQCNPDGSSTNLIIYGHNMRNGTMFHELLKFEKKDFWMNHKKISFDTLYWHGEYEIFAVFRMAVGSKDEFKYYQFINTELQDEYDEFVRKCVENSIYKTGVTPKFGEPLITLSTCSYNRTNERFVVVARMVDRK